MFIVVLGRRVCKVRVVEVGFGVAVPDAIRSRVNAGLFVWTSTSVRAE
jgi:hypothetical protein